MKIMLCGRPGSCCPTVDYDKIKDEVIIEDDYCNTVTMTKEQFEILQKAEL